MCLKKVSSIRSITIIVLSSIGIIQLVFNRSYDASSQGSACSAEHCCRSTASQLDPAGFASATSGHLFTANVERSFPIEHIRFDDATWFGRNISKTNHDKDHHCEKWSVITTIANFSAAIEVQSTLITTDDSDWCMVIVYDRKTPVDLIHRANYTRTVHLTVEMQERMAMDDAFVRSLPWNHIGRKNIGYLYAISRGAKLIWDMDDDNVLKDKEAFRRILPPKDGVISVYQAAINDFPSYNPYVQFGPPHNPVWPRGFPLDHIKEERSWNNTLTKTKIPYSKIGIIQSLADHDPDLDAIYRLTMKIPFNFNKAGGSSLPIALPPRTLAPLNAQACLFTYDSFWMLLLPVTTHGRVSDIWRGYAGQVLLWNLGLHVLFSPPIVDQYRNAHNYLADFNAELPLYEKSTALVNFLANWRPKQSSLIGRIEELSIELYTRKFVEIDDVYSSQKWLQSLLDVGYDFPKLTLEISSVWP